MNANSSFLAKGLHLYLLLAVVATTLLSWFLVNSLLILLLTGCRLWDGRAPLNTLRKAFSNPLFLAFFALFLLDVSGFFHTHDPQLVWMHVQRKATLVAIPFVIAAGPFADGAGFRRLLWYYCLLLTGLSCWCLSVAVVRYVHTGVTQVFFYHELTAVLGINAVYYSAYILMALIFLLSGAAPAGRGRALLTVFFTGMMILLASKLLLVVLVVIYAAYLWRYRSLMTRSRVQGLVLLVVLGMGIVAFTNNPVVGRYMAILPKEQSGAAGFNGVSLRLFIWHSAKKILDQEHAWLCGISAGDSQDRLNQCYLDSGMSVGYLEYNFHNEYVEVLVDDGLVGLIVFLVALGVLGWEARRTMEGMLVLLVIGVLAGTESILEMQQSVFLACLFPMLPWGLKNVPGKPPSGGF